MDAEQPGKPRPAADLKITTLAERPELTGAFWALGDAWPQFVTEDPIGWILWGRIVSELPEYVLVATDESGELVARALSVPFALAAKGRGTLPDGGWDRVLMWAFSDVRHGTEPDTVSAIEVTVAPGAQGGGLSYAMLDAMRANARALGYGTLVAPVRPSAKHLEPRTPMEEYAHRRRPDGLPHDPWLRVHVRVGGVIESVARNSMTVSGTLEEWRGWTGLPFDAAGEGCEVEVPKALVPVHCAPDQGYAVYVEPNVWVRHTL
ncbi:N-acetyltransferase [Streptomyces luteolus]|uniref:N-acetyltransferase n=1 Tax=Streptomyces luteolus TaxID=3043615 RepID=A0ABT6T2T6_9ACTN|nr:N-acetyltransferase [Streptomyces sp. B-S-A12]MDI3421966.1 N-acetyltransferase [Streptomyces sp. B-S-A12]